MSTAASPTYTPEDLLLMPNGKDFELVDGDLVETHVSTLSSWVGGRAYRLLASYVEDRDMGVVWPADNGLQCFPDDPGKVRRPDTSFIVRERYSVNQLSEGFLHVAPDLVVEVISPNDLVRDVEKKIAEYLGAGVRLLWVIDPDARIVHVYRGNGSAARLKQDDELSGEDVVPGFRCLVNDLFPKA